MQPVMSDQTPSSPAVSQEEAEAAVRTLIRWAGDNPEREGLIETPKRVAKSYRELFQGYEVEPRDYLEKTFEEVGGYDELIVLKDIRFVSFCEHHMLPVVGKANVGYLPTDRVVGISKLARVLNGFARRLQVQERLTAEVAKCIWDNLHPQGVAVVIDAQHINFIDYSGVEMLHQEARRLRGLGRSLTLRRARPQVVEELKKLEGPDHCPISFEG